MSIFNELLLKINEIPNGFTDNIKDDLKSALELLEEFKTDYISTKTKARELAQKAKILTTTLQSINEDEDEPIKEPESQKTQRKSSRSTASTSSVQSVKITALEEQNGNEKPKRVSKKRSKDEVEDMSSPEQDKRPKRNASVRAQNVISKQRKVKVKPWWEILNENGAVLMSASKLVNVNLTQKMRRDEPERDPKEPKERSSRRRKGKEDKENAAPIVQVKQEKISLPSEETMECEQLPTEVKVKREHDDLAMPPPTLPVPKPRGRAKNKEKEEDKDKSIEEETGRSRRNTKKKQTDAMPPPPVASARSTRASSRASSRQNSVQSEEIPPPEPRPKRTRAKKKVSEPPPEETEKTPEKNVPASPAEKPRPKRTRRGKNAEKQEEPAKEPQVILHKMERITIPVEATGSPILPNQKDKNNVSAKEPKPIQPSIQAEESKEKETVEDLEKTRVIHTNVPRQSIMNATIEIVAHSTPKNTMNETVVIERNRGTVVLEKQQNVIMDATVIIEKAKAAKTSDLTEDDSIMTNDESEDKINSTPPPSITKNQPTSAVKEKVQKFEELASRVTRTKTRAMAKNDDEQETHTPPDKIGKNGLSAETLTKMNNLIFNGKPNTTQLSNSACKPRANVPVKTNIPNSTSKITTINKLREEEIAREKEDARSKKEALLEARRELQRRKREDKMAAAAAAREQAERERRAALEAAQRGREEKQIHADLGRAERLRDAERKKQELARKVAETEERRRGEERARQQRLAEEQKRAEIARRKQQEEAEAVKKEAALMAREIEKRQKEYIEKQKQKRMEAEKIATPVKAMYGVMEPVYMKDGFEFLHSDEEEETRPRRPPPPWSTTKARWQQLTIQAHIKSSHIDRLFSVRVHSPDLREIFPDIDRRVLKRTSSAVWRTPDRADRLPALRE